MDCAVGELYCSFVERVGKTLPIHAGKHFAKLGGSQMTKPHVENARQIRHGPEVISMGCRGSSSCAVRFGQLVVGVFTGASHSSSPYSCIVGANSGSEYVRSFAEGGADVTRRGFDRWDTAGLGFNVYRNAAEKEASPCGGAENLVSNAVWYDVL